MLYSGFMANPNPKGRKSIYTKELHETIVRAVQQCYYIKTAAELIGITPYVIQKWMSAAEEHIRTNHPEGDECTNSCGEFTVAKRRLLKDINSARAAFTNDKMQTLTRHAKRYWLPAAWLLERTQPENFALVQRSEVHHSGEVNHKHVLSVEQRQKVLMAGQRSLEIDSLQKSDDEIVEAEIVSEENESQED